MRDMLFRVLFAAFVLCMAGCGKDGGDPDPGPGPEPEPEPRVFVHPGVTVTSDDIARMRELVASQTQPAWGAYQTLSTHPYASATYTMKGPWTVISADASGPYPQADAHEPDFAAAYLNALMWAVTQDEAHAQKALDIIYGYASTIETVDVTKNIILLTGFVTFHAVKTMEILRHTWTVPQQKLDAIDAMLRDKFLPHMIGDLSKAPYHIGNQDAVGCRGLLAMGVYLDDEELYDWAVDFYLNSGHNGCIKNYIDPTTGQCQETGRDQIHAQLGLGVMAELCEIAHKQGDDLFGAYDNLLLKGFEYTAKYNAGLTVPFSVMSDVTGRSDWAWKNISTEGRGTLLPYYEIVRNHYAVRKNMTSKVNFTTYLLEEGGARPETYLQKSDLQHTFASLVYYNSK